ncbi:uncharacterized protein Fot_21750 [Forsythia ovata]|uniref:Uncharacterized protein n=1 Tax=Forsythia ovata TaxID=205694 RepID=A0ABD1UVR4_9LAMI
MFLPHQYQTAQSDLPPGTRSVQKPGEGLRQTQRVHSPAAISPSQLWFYEIDDDEEINPFSEGIQRCKVPYDFVISEIGKYARQRDPIDHLLNYNANMGIVGAIPALKCKAFPLTLERNALRWYKKLLSRVSIVGKI